MMDTRASSPFNGPFGPPFLAADSSRRGEFARPVPVPSSSCGVPAAAAYSFKFTVLPPPDTAVAWLVAWPQGQPWPGTELLSATIGAMSSNTAIVPASAAGAIQIAVTDSTDVVVDVNGYYIEQTLTRFRGAWSPAMSYAADDIVRSLATPASSYIAVRPSRDVDPEQDVASGGANWNLLAQAGATGPVGAPGAMGPVGPQGVSGPQGPPGVLSRCLEPSNHLRCR